METLVDPPYPDDIPTKVTEAIPSRLLTLACRIDRLAELALERLAICPDADAIVAASVDLEQIRRLAGAVLR